VLRYSKTIAMLALAGCGARAELDVVSGSGGTSATGGASGTLGGSAAHLSTKCAPADGPALQLDIDNTSTCPWPDEQRPGLQFFIWGPDLAGLHDGVTLHVSGDLIHGYTTAGRLTAPGAPLVAATSGSIVFTTFVPNQGAMGTYDITLVDGSTAQGSFSANACLGYSLCG
jgi:hypothetical protein